MCIMIMLWSVFSLTLAGLNGQIHSLNWFDKNRERWCSGNRMTGLTTTCPLQMRLLFDIFKKEIGKWKCEKCPRRICKTYIEHVGFIWKNWICILFIIFLYTFIYIFIMLFMGEGGSSQFWLVHMLLVFCNWRRITLINKIHK